MMSKYYRRAGVSATIVLVALSLALVLVAGACDGDRGDPPAAPTGVQPSDEKHRPTDAQSSQPERREIVEIVAWSSRPDPKRWGPQPDAGEQTYERLIYLAVREYALYEGNRKFVTGQALGKLGSSSVPALLKVLVSADREDVRAAAAELLGMSGDARAVAPLHVALFERPVISQAAAEALDLLDKNWRQGELAKRMVPHITAVLSGKSADESIRGGFWQWLMDRRRDESVHTSGSSQRVMDILEEDARWVGRGRSMGGGEAEALIARRGQGAHLERLDILAAGGAALGHLGDPAGVSVLAGGLKKAFELPTVMTVPKRLAIETICKSLAQLDPKWHDSPGGRQAIENFQGVLVHADHSVRNLGAMAIGYTRAPNASVPLARAWVKRRFTYRATHRLARVGLPRSRDRKRDYYLLTVGPIANALIAMNDKRTLPVIREMMGEEDAGRAIEAIAVFALVGGDDAVAELAGGIKDASEAQALNRIAALGLTRSPAAVGPLTEIYRNGLGRMSYLQAETAFENLQQDEQSRMEDRYGSRDGAIRALASQRGDLDDDARLLAVWALGQLGQDTVGQTLLSAAGQGAPEIRTAALRGLRGLKTDGAVPVAIEALSDGNPDLRDEAIALLAEAGDARAVEPLLAILKQYDPSAEDDDRSRWRPTSRPSGGRSTSRPSGGRPTSRPSVGRSTSRPSGGRSTFDTGYGPGRPSASTCWGVVDALSVLGDERAIEPLVVALARGLDRAYYALSRIDPAWSRSNAARKAVPSVISTLKAGDPRIRISSMTLLGIMADRRALKPMVEMMGQSGLMDVLDRSLAMLDANWRDTPEARSAVDTLIRQLQAPARPTKFTGGRQMESWFEWYKLTRLEAVFFLGELGDARAAKPLLAVFTAAVKPPPPPDPDREGGFRRRYDDRISSDNDELAARCAEAVGKLGDRSAVPVLCSAFSTALAKPKDEDRMYDRDKAPPDWQVAAARALGLLGDPRAVEVLAKILQPTGKPQRQYPSSRDRRDPYADLAHAAAHALVQIGDPTAPDVLVKALGSPQCREAAAKALAALGDKKAVAPLIQALCATTPKEGPAIIEALSQLDPGWQGSPVVQEQVAKEIGALVENPSRLTEQNDYRKDEHTIPDPVQIVMLNRLDKQWRDREVTRLAVRRCSRRLKQAERSSEAAQIIRLLAYFGGEESIEPVLAAAARLGYRLDGPAMSALSRFNAKWGKTEVALKMVPKFTAVMESNNVGPFTTHSSYGPQYECLAAASFLGQIGSKEAVTALKAELRNSAAIREELRKKARLNTLDFHTANQYQERRQHGQKLLAILAPHLTSDDVAALQSELVDGKTVLLPDVVQLATLTPAHVDPKLAFEAMKSDTPEIHEAGKQLFRGWSRRQLEAGWGNPARFKQRVPLLLEALEHRVGLAADEENFAGRVLMGRGRYMSPQTGQTVGSLAATILGRLEDPSTVEPMVKQFSAAYEEWKAGLDKPVPGDDPQVLLSLSAVTGMRFLTEAANALALLEDRKAVPPLIAALAEQTTLCAPLLKDPTGGRGGRPKPRDIAVLGTRLDVMTAIAEALGRFGDQRAVEPLKALRDLMPRGYYPVNVQSVQRTVIQALELLDEAARKGQ